MSAKTKKITTALTEGRTPLQAAWMDWIYMDTLTLSSLLTATRSKKNKTFLLSECSYNLYFSNCAELSCSSLLCYYIWPLIFSPLTIEASAFTSRYRQVLTGICGSAKSLVKNFGLLLIKNLAAFFPDSWARVKYFCRERRENNTSVTVTDCISCVLLQLHHRGQSFLHLLHWFIVMSGLYCCMLS